MWSAQCLIMAPFISINYVTAENAAAGHEVSSMALQKDCMCPQKNAVLLGENKTEACTGPHISKSKSAQCSNDGEENNFVLKQAEH